MNFADNLKQLRKEHHLSQEELAELLDVSRQAVSKWEQGAGYPEVETLLLLSQKLNVSLDSLMGTEGRQEGDESRDNVARTIMILSPHENVIVANCCKVSSSQKFRGGKSAPQYALFGVSSGARSLWGETTTFLGWYADEEQIAKEISGIHKAMETGAPAYELKYSAKVERHWLRVKMV